MFRYSTQVLRTEPCARADNRKIPSFANANTHRQPYAKYVASAEELQTRSFTVDSISRSLYFIE